jgi:predicted outer membrane protein
MATKEMVFLRTERNNLLIETDVWALTDRTMTQKQKDYRQALRDLPSTASPELDSDDQIIGVTWPIKPE